MDECNVVQLLRCWLLLCTRTSCVRQTCVMVTEFIYTVELIPCLRIYSWRPQQRLEIQGQRGPYSCHRISIAALSAGAQSWPRGSSLLNTVQIKCKTQD